MTRADALELYSKAKGAEAFGSIHDVYVEAFKAGVVPEMCDETVMAVIILGDWVIEAAHALERLTEVNREMETALYAKIEMFRQIGEAAPDTPIELLAEAPLELDDPEAQIPPEVITPDHVLGPGERIPSEEHTPDGFGVRWRGTSAQFEAHGPEIIANFVSEIRRVTGQEIAPDSHSGRESDPPG